jgi:orotidine-5'-phosphate decarboxylase
MAANPLICSIDTPEPARARALIAAVSGSVGMIKLGLEFFTANGPQGVRAVVDGAPLFLDLKLHDIPNTVAAAVRSASALAPRLLTLHCAGGAAMMQAAAEAADQAGSGMRLMGVTVLTSLDDSDLAAVGQRGPVREQVLRLALLARQSGLSGIVCSPHEVAALRAACGPDVLLVVPGIRPAGAALGDQKRVMAPREALAAGADYLVIGRPIIAAPDPAAAARAILSEIR